MNAQTTAKQTSKMSQIGKTRYMVQVAMLGAAAVVLMFFDIPLPFAPSFYKIDLSEVPVLIGAFAMGPLAGAAIELIKILLNLVMKGSTTAGVGEVANFLIGCAYVMPAAWIYKAQKTKKNAVIGMAVGTVFMAAVGGMVRENMEISESVIMKQADQKMYENKKSYIYSFNADNSNKCMLLCSPCGSR